MELKVIHADPLFPGAGRPLGANPSSLPTPLLETAANRHLPPTAVEIERAARKVMERTLAAMKTEMDAWPLQDELTMSIRHWHQVFMRNVNAPVDGSRLFLGMLRLLQQILIEPMRLAPLSEPLLGQDGKTYDKKILQLHLSTLSEHKRLQVPCFPVKEHLLANYMIRYLRAQGLERTIPEIEAEYVALFSSGSLPEIPTPEAVAEHKKVLRLQARIERVRQERLGMQHQAQEETRRVHAFVQTLNAQTERIEAAVEANLAQIRTINAAMREEQDALVEKLAKEDALELKQVKEALNIYSARVDALSAECDVLSQECRTLSSDIASLRGQCLNLQRDVAELKLALAKRQTSWTKGLVGIATHVVVCAAVSYMCPPGLSVAPMQNGFKLQFMTTF